MKAWFWSAKRLRKRYCCAAYPQSRCRFSKFKKWYLTCIKGKSRGKWYKCIYFIYIYYYPILLYMYMCIVLRLDIWNCRNLFKVWKFNFIYNFFELKILPLSPLLFRVFKLLINLAFVIAITVVIQQRQNVFALKFSLTFNFRFNSPNTNWITQQRVTTMKSQRLFTYIAIKETMRQEINKMVITTEVPEASLLSANTWERWSLMMSACWYWISRLLVACHDLSCYVKY